MGQWVFTCGMLSRKSRADSDVLEVLVTGGGGSHPAQLLAQLVVIRVVGQRNEGEEPAGLVLQRAQRWSRCSTRSAAVSTWP